MKASTLGEIVRFHRKRANLSQKELADLAQVGKTVVFDLEKGKESIQLDTINAIMFVLNIRFSVNGPIMNQYQNKYAEEVSS